MHAILNSLRMQHPHMVGNTTDWRMKRMMETEQMTLTYCISMILTPIQVVIGGERWIVTCETGEGGWEMWRFYWEQMWLTPEWLRLSVQRLCRQGSSAIFSPSAFSLSDFFFFTIIILTLHLSTTYLQSILYCFPKLLIYLSFQRFSILSWTFLIIYSVTFCQAFYQFWFLFKYFFVSSVSLKAMSRHVVSQLYAFRARSTHGDSSCVLVSD